MARLACCLVLISLCLSIVLEPSLALVEDLSNDSSTLHLAPEATPVASAAPPKHALVKKLCHETRKPRLCAKIVQGDKETLKTMNPITMAKASIDLATTMASRVGAHMSNQLKTNQVKEVSRGFVEACSLSYENAVEELNLAYINFENNPEKAISSLNKVDQKIVFCADSLKLTSQKEVSSIVETNKVILGLVQVAENVSKSQEH
ncbi:hypothetical protein VNO77_33818 [Canavalia gladiata]|uniref:Pectinesterase inhibitor domain-containing protein n=1 Tax=Canavalia gladiata TaxID=3824 RepID=A0AAN9KGE7_CANGL